MAARTVAPTATTTFCLGCHTSFSQPTETLALDNLIQLLDEPTWLDSPIIIGNHHINRLSRSISNLGEYLNRIPTLFELRNQIETYDSEKERERERGSRSYSRILLRASWNKKYISDFVLISSLESTCAQRHRCALEEALARYEQPRATEFRRRDCSGGK